MSYHLCRGCCDFDEAISDYCLTQCVNCSQRYCEKCLDEFLSRSEDNKLYCEECMTEKEYDIKNEVVREMKVTNKGVVVYEGKVKKNVSSKS